MVRKYAGLQRIDNDRKITKETDYEFLYQLQYALLLALRERGTLNAAQFYLAEERLLEQKRGRARSRTESGGNT